MILGVKFFFKKNNTLGMIIGDNWNMRFNCMIQVHDRIKLSCDYMCV